MSICKITTIAVPAAARPEFEKSFAHRRGFVDIVDGFEGLQLLRPFSGDEPYQLLTFWRDDAAYRAWRESNPRYEAGADGTHRLGDHQDMEHKVLDYEVIADVDPIRE